MRTVLNMLKEASGTYGNAPYVVEKEESGWVPLSFSQVDKESAVFARALITRGFKADDKVAILSEGRRNWVTGEYGILKARCISVPLSIKLLEEELPFRLNHSESRGILISEYSLDKLLAVLREIKKQPLIIVMGDYLKDVSSKADRNGLKMGEEIILYKDFLKEGAQASEEVEKELATRLSQVREDDTVTISYTSGTTGNPKGIMLTHLNYWANSLDAVNTCPIPEKSRSLIILPLDHSFAHTVGIYISLRLGLAMHFVDARGGGMAILRNIPDNLKEVKPYFLLTVPALSGNFMKKIQSGVAAKGAFINGIFTRGVEAGIQIHGDGFRKAPLLIRLRRGFSYYLAEKLVFPKVREIFGGELAFCVGGGALLEIVQQEFFNAIGCPIYQGYGLTEAAPIICTNTPGWHKFGTSGITMPSIECRIMENETAPAEEGVPGELVIRGDNVMKGYYKNPDASAEVLKDGWLWTGDLGYFDSDGFLVITGRAKALLISADGEKYSPETIEEAVINNSLLINQIMVYNEQRRYTTALVTLNEEAVKKELKNRGITSAAQALDIIGGSFYNFRKESPIPSQWVPSTFTIIEEPFSEKNQLINSTMKLVRHKVRDYYQEKIENMYGSNGTELKSPENIAALKNLFDLS